MNPFFALILYPVLFVLNRAGRSRLQFSAPNGLFCIRILFVNRFFKRRDRTGDHSFIRFSFAIEAMVGIFIGQTSIQDSDFEQVLPKCSP